jgi:prepilin-type N-terminal cleavage/methylation domain-containing protein
MDNRAAALPQRSGFTLVELLVVITIIAVLAALITPAVFQARATTRNAAIKAEIDMLHMAMMNYKNEYGSFPPSYSVGSAGAAESHVKRLFPRFSGTVSNSTSPLNAICNWLQGYSSNPTDPLNGSLKKLFEFNQVRKAGDIYYPSGKPKSPYIYISSGDYDKFDESAGTVSNGWPEMDEDYVVGSDTFTIPTKTYSPQELLSGDKFNKDTFQILCAGQDELWGTDDDLSNFWKGTRGDQ